MYNMSQSEFNEMVKDISSLNRFDLHGEKTKEERIDLAVFKRDCPCRF